MILMLLLGFGGLISCGYISDDVRQTGFSEVTAYDEIQDTVQTEAGSEEVRTDRETTENRQTTETAGQIYVYVCGAVMHPGVYMLDAQDRQYRALEMAGGATEEACMDRLDLAAQMVDGQRLYVPYETEAGCEEAAVDTWPGDDVASHLVNINTADEAQLMTLPGIGASKAKKIIEYRTVHGAFGSIEALKEVTGIGEATFESLRDLITT